MFMHDHEDYLTAIYQLQQEELPVHTNSIARELGLTPASVTGGVKRLALLGYVRHEPYQGVTLTPAGERIALEVIRRQRLIGMHLVQALGYNWDEVYEEAKSLERAASPLFIHRVEAALGYPEMDSDGLPILTADRQGPVELEDPYSPKMSYARSRDSPLRLTLHIGREGAQAVREVFAAEVVEMRHHVSMSSCGRWY